MKKQVWLLGILTVFLSGVAMQAQQISAAFGVRDGAGSFRCERQRELFFAVIARWRLPRV